MQKEELLHLHMLMIQVKKYYEHKTGNQLQTPEYDMLGVTPLHIHKSKNVHRVALMTLGNEVVAKMRDSFPASKEPEEAAADTLVRH